MHDGRQRLIDQGASVRLDPRVTLALVVTVFVQVIGVFLWAGAQSERLSLVERRVETQASTTERLARLEAHVEQARASLARIEDRLDRRTR